MAEQISRRSNNVTSAPFDAPFENHLVRFGSGTLNLKDSLDAMEGWARLTNVWHENEGEATARPGETAFGFLGGGARVHSIRKLRTPLTGGMTRIWGKGSELHWGQVGGLGAADSGYSGDPLALVPHRPTLSGDSWMFVGDRNKMRKIRGDGLDLPIGLPKPVKPPVTSLAPEYRTGIAMCDGSDGTGASSWTPVPGTDGTGAATGTPEAAVEEETPMAPGFCIGCITNPGAINAEDGYDSWWGVAVSRDLTILAEVGGSATRPASDDDQIHVFLKSSHPHKMAEIRVYIVVSEDFTPLVLPGTRPEAGANPDAYVKAFRASDYVPFIAGQSAQIDAAEQARIYALRDADAERRGTTDTRESWHEIREQTDSARARSLQMGVGSHQWFGYGQIGASLRRGDFQRIGSTPGRDWSTVTGIIFYVRTIPGVDEIVGVWLDDLYLTGGSGPDTVEPGLQQYDYRVTHYDPRTGAESNGSDVMEGSSSFIDTIRRGIVIDPVAYGSAWLNGNENPYVPDPDIKQRLYRRGGSLYDDWYFVGQNSLDGEPFTDELTDTALAAAGTLHIDHFEPVPTIDANGNTVLAQPLRALWGPLEGMLLGCGDRHRPGYLYFSVPGQPDHWSAFGNVEVCAPSEELMNGGIVGHQGFVFSRLRMHLLYPNLTGEVGITATPSLCTRGLLGRWAFCIGPGGTIYFVAEDGVFATQGGAEVWLSEAINPLFYGFPVNGYQPIDKTEEAELRLTVWENALYFQYEDTGGHRQVMVYSILQKFWRHYHFDKEPACLQGEDEDVLLMGGENGIVYTHSGTSDAGTPIECVIRTGSNSGGRREEKLFGDLFLDADGAGNDLELQVFLNEETVENLTEIVIAGSERERYVIHAFGNSPQKAHSIACELRWSTSGEPPTIFQLGYAITLQPDLTNTRVTNWDDLNSPDEVWLTGLTIDVDTGGENKTFHVERDFAGSRTVVATLNVTAQNRHKFKFSWPAVPAHQVRIRPDSGECAAWLLYRADWIYVQEPPRISAWDIHFENAWDQYYTGLDLYCDTFGVEKHIEVYVDGVRLRNTLANLDYWPIVTVSRQVVHLTLPWGRGHVFRFVAVDANPGLLYTHRWHLQEEPSEQANWNQNFSILGTHADKWLKAVIFECDTFDQTKQVQIEVDGVAVETLDVRANGRRVVQLALNQQMLGRVWRMFPIDGHPGRLYSAEPIFDEEPFQLDRWETQETNHGLPGWFYPLYAHITLKSTAPVTLRTVMHHNQTGGTTTYEYPIPATGGQKQRRFLAGFYAGKGVLIKYLLTSPEPFFLYRDETTVVIQPWGAARAITVQPFGNDDLDPSRTMTHAVLAAQATGGSAAPPGGA